MQRFAHDQSSAYPFLHDIDQSITRALGTKVTPHVGMLDGEHRLVYRGAPDGDRPDESRRHRSGCTRRSMPRSPKLAPAPSTRAARAGYLVKWRGFEHLFLDHVPHVPRRSRLCRGADDKTTPRTASRSDKLRHAPRRSDSGRYRRPMAGRGTTVHTSFPSL